MSFGVTPENTVFRDPDGVIHLVVYGTTTQVEPLQAKTFAEAKEEARALGYEVTHYKERGISYPIE